MASRHVAEEMRSTGATHHGDLLPTDMSIALFLVAAAQGRRRLELGRVCPSVLTQRYSVSSPDVHSYCPHL